MASRKDTEGPYSIMQMLTNEVGNEWAIACPSCGQFNSHIASVYSRRSADADEARQSYPGTQLVTVLRPSWRRPGLVIEFNGECEHRWALVIQQHKGTDYVFVEDKGRSTLIEHFDALPLDDGQSTVVGDSRASRDPIA